MPTDAQTREEDLRRLLTDAIEVQLAALKAGISFWSEWIEQTSAFVQSATKTLTSINQDDTQTKDSILELIDAGRASLRSLTEIPRHTATKFIEELDKLQQETDSPQAATKSAPAAKPAAPAPTPAGVKRSVVRPRPKRSGRVKT